MTIAPPSTAATTPRRRVGTWLLLPWLLLSLLGTVWALATPIGGSPDEPAHVIKAASVVRGELLPSEMGYVGGILDVPAGFDAEHSQGCFPFDATESAACAPEFEGDPSVIVESHSSASLYNPVYYWIVGWPSLLAPDVVGIYAMRILSAIVCSFFIAVSFWMIGSWRSRRLPALGVVAGVTPMVIYLLGTVNPNTLEFTGGLAIFTAMLSIVLHPDESLLRRRLVLLVVASLLVSNTRGISPLWVALLLAIPLVLLTGRQLIALLRRPSVLVSIALIIVGALFSAWWTFSTNSLGTAPSTGPTVASTNPGVGLSPLEGFTTMVQGFTLQIRQMIGILGWLDTFFHPSVYYAFFVVFGLVGLAALVWARGRRLVFVVLMGLVFFFAPPVLQAGFVTSGGFIWQGRYTLVLLMTLMLAFGAAAAYSARFQRFEQRMLGRRVIAAGTAIILGIWWAGSTWGFSTTMRRFTVGYLDDWSEMVDPGAWVPPLGAWTLIVLFGLLSAGLAAWLVLATRLPKVVAAAAETDETAEPVRNRIGAP
jgi:hypothetical protein